jgi:ABC-type Fe3+ transport system permease subunit
MGKRTITYPLQTIVLILFFFLAVVPVLYTLTLTFAPGGSLKEDLSSFSADTWRLLGRSVALASLVASLSTLLGTVAGFLLYKTSLPLRRFFRVALLIPLFLSPYLLAVAWKDFFFLLFGTTAFITSTGGVILVMTTLYTPLAMLITGSALTTIDARLEESGWVIAGARSTLLKVTLPLIRPALLSAFVLIFIFSISEFSVPAFLGLRVFTTEIFTQFSAFYNHSLAILQSTVLILLCVVLLLAEGQYLADAPFLAVGSRGDVRRHYDLSFFLRAGKLLIPLWFLFSVVVPFGVLAVQAFRIGPAPVARAFSLLRTALPDSLLLAFAGALLIVLTGVAAAWHTPGSRTTTTNRIFDWVLLLLFAIPSTVFGISLIKFYNHPSLGIIYSGLGIILIGYVGKFSFIAAKLTGNALRQIPASLDEAARLTGLSTTARLMKIHLPLILPTLFAAFLVAFIFSFGELGTTIMVYPPGTEIMPIKVFTIMANAPQSLTSAMTLIVLLITLLLITVFFLLIRPLMKKFSYARY